jgi:glycosyltransferase involved in cell wall biosynthesis
MRIISIFDDFKNRGGAQYITLSLADNLGDNTPIVLTITPLNLIHDEYKTKDIQFETMNIKNILKYRNNTIILSHARKLTSILVLLNRFLIKKLNIIYIAHNVFNNLKLFSLYPENIIAVSNAVRQNLIDYFKIDEKKIKVIFNGIEDVYNDKVDKNFYKKNNDRIKIILIGRLTKVKQQVELVYKTKGLLQDNVEFYFAGEGEDLSLLKDAVSSYSQYKILGHIDIKKELTNYDYICLFSVKEGLPISLIEGCMFGKPLITNDIPSVLDINKHGYNGFVVNNWQELINCINTLPAPGSNVYSELSSNARKQYLDLFSIDKMLFEYKNYIKCYYEGN